jgi:hypothetical protein
MGLAEERETRYRVDTLLARLMDNIPVLARPADTPAPSESHEAGAQRQRRPRSHPHKGRVLLAIQANLAAHRSRGGGGGSVAERDLPYQVPELRYVEVEDQARLASMRVQSSNWWGVQIPIALCVRCEMRYTEDPNKDAYGIPIHDYPEDDLEVVCRDCQSAALSETLEEEMLRVLESKLGLAERDRDALRSFIETVFTDPKKILQVKDLDNRVRELEKHNGRLWAALGIEGGLLAALLAAVVAIALALAS